MGAPYASYYINSRGAVYAFYSDGTTLPGTASWTTYGDATYDLYGFSLAVGDLNGSSPKTPDLIIGAPWVQRSGSSYGAVYVYQGGGSGLAASRWATLEGSGVNGQFGYSVAYGFFNGFGLEWGYASVAVGAPYHSDGQTEEGKVFVYYGGHPTLNTVADWSAQVDQPYAHFGSSLAAGDFRQVGNYVEDLLIGAPDYDGTANNAGAIFLWYGSYGSGGLGSDGVFNNVDWSDVSTTAGAHYGTRISFAKQYAKNSPPAFIAGAPDNGSGAVNVWKYQ